MAKTTNCKSEATDLARQFGLVTPYTAYLIMQDEEGRHVAENNQVMRDFRAGRPGEVFRRRCLR